MEKHEQKAFEDFEMLILQICNELKKRDKNKNGLILHHYFMEVMEIFKIEYGTELMDYMMKNCYVTEDGYINYKQLLLLHDIHSKSITNNSQNVSEAIYPKYMILQDTYDEDSYKMKNEIIRILYSQWDKCILKDEEFIKKLEEANIEISTEFKRALSLYGPSRTLKFSTVMKTLYINDATDRKNRFDYSHNINKNTQNNETFKSRIARNPISWGNKYENDLENLFQNVEMISNFLNNKEYCNNLEQKKTTRCFFNLTLKNLIKAYISNDLPENGLRICLEKLQIKISPELENLIKYHQSDNNGKFKDFITIIYRCLSNDTLHMLHCTGYNISEYSEMFQA